MYNSLFFTLSRWVICACFGFWVRCNTKRSLNHYNSTNAPKWTRKKNWMTLQLQSHSIRNNNNQQQCNEQEMTLSVSFLWFLSFVSSFRTDWSTCLFPILVSFNRWFSYRSTAFEALFSFHLRAHEQHWLPAKSRNISRIPDVLNVSI